LSSGTKREQDKRATSDRHQEGSLLTLDCPDAGRNSVVKPEGTSAALFHLSPILEKTEIKPG
jgi:hypothetical protein